MTEQEFQNGLTTEQATFYNARLVSLRTAFQASYATSVNEVVEAKATEAAAREATIATLQAEVATKQSQIIEMEASLAAKQTELDDANATIAERDASISSQNSAVSNQAGTIVELQARIAEKDASLSSKNNQIDALQSQVDTLSDRVEVLKQNQRFDPRQINALAFYNRITKEDFARLAASPDPQLTAIAQAILAYVEHEKIWPVVFDSPDMQGMVGYLLQSGFLTQERVEQFTANASWQEAFYAAD